MYLSWILSDKSPVVLVFNVLGRRLSFPWPSGQNFRLGDSDAWVRYLRLKNKPFSSCLAWRPAFQEHCQDQLAQCQYIVVLHRAPLIWRIFIIICLVLFILIFKIYVCFCLTIGQALNVNAIYCLRSVLLYYSQDSNPVHRFS